MIRRIVGVAEICVVRVRAGSCDNIRRSDETPEKDSNVDEPAVWKEARAWDKAAKGQKARMRCKNYMHPKSRALAGVASKIAKMEIG